MSSVNQQAFTFIPVDCRSKPAQEAIRAHIMRRRHREARPIQKPSHVKEPQEKYEEQIHFWEQRSDQTGPPNDSIVPISDISSSTESPLSLENTLSDSPDHELCSVPLWQSSNAEATSPGKYKRQFDSCLTNQEDVEEMLIQYYIQYGGGSEVPRQFLRAYRETTGTFSAFLAMVATNYSDESGRSPPLDTAELENRALQEVLTQIGHIPTMPASSTMITVAMLANLRETRNELDLVDCHWTALKKMVDISGGINHLRMNQDLYAFLLWMEAVVLSKTSGSLVPTSHESMQSVTMQQEFAGFFGAVRQNLQRLASTTCMSEQSPRLTSPMLTMFRLLPHKRDPYSTNKWCRARLACLLFFAVLDHRSQCPVQEHPFYQAVAKEVNYRGKKYTVYPDELFFIIARISNQDDRCETIWRTMRLVCVVKQLAKRDINTCQRLLMVHLGLSTNLGLNMVLDEWDELHSRVGAPA